MSTTAEGRYPCDLHCHTVRSDGNDTPQELIDNAVRCGLHAVAITDHDISPPLQLELADGGPAVASVAYAAARGVRLILGYEFSCDTHVDDVHICGYGLDWEHPDLLAEVAAAKRSKSEAYEELCRRLTASGHADGLGSGRPAVHAARRHARPAGSGRSAAEAHLRGDGRARATRPPGARPRCWCATTPS